MCLSVVLEAGALMLIAMHGFVLMSKVRVAEGLLRALLPPVLTHDRRVKRDLLMQRKGMACLLHSSDRSFSIITFSIRGALLTNWRNVYRLVGVLLGKYKKGCIEKSSNI